MADEFRGPQQLRLKEGVTFEHAVAALRELSTEGRNAVSVPAVQEAYIDWVEKAEAQLAGLTHDRSVICMFQTERYWRIRDIHGHHVRPFQMVQAEINLHCAALDRMLDDLEQRHANVNAAPGQIVVLDTHVLLHYLPPDQIEWPDVVNAKEVRLVIPLRVIEELDEKKFSDSKLLRTRSRALLPQLEAVIAPGGKPGALRDHVTIEVPLADRTRGRPADADTEVLETCREIEQLTTHQVVLVTADTGMRIRAQAHGLQVCRPPDTYRRLSSTDDAASTARAP